MDKDLATILNELLAEFKKINTNLVKVVTHLATMAEDLKKLDDTVEKEHEEAHGDLQ